VKDLAPRIDRLVRREDHRPVSEVAFVHHLEEHVGGIGRVDEIADLVDHEDGDVGVGAKGFGETPFAAGDAEIVDEFVGGREEGVKSILDRPVGDRDGQRRLARPRGARENEATAFAHEFRAEVAAEELRIDRRLEGPIELLDGLEEGETGATDGALDARLAAVRYFLGNEERQILAVGELLRLRPDFQFRIEPPHGGQMKPAKHGVQIDGRGHAVSLRS